MSSWQHWAGVFYDQHHTQTRVTILVFVLTPGGPTHFRAFLSFPGWTWMWEWMVEILFWVNHQNVQSKAERMPREEGGGIEQCWGNTWKAAPGHRGRPHHKQPSLYIFYLSCLLESNKLDWNCLQSLQKAIKTKQNKTPWGMKMYSLSSLPEIKLLLEYSSCVLQSPGHPLLVSPSVWPGHLSQT